MPPRIPVLFKRIYTQVVSITANIPMLSWPMYRIVIPKPGGGQRPLCILPIRCRVVQTGVPSPRHRAPLAPTGGQTRALGSQVSGIQHHAERGLDPKAQAAPPFDFTEHKLVVLLNL